MQLMSELRRIAKTLPDEDRTIVLEAAKALELDPYPLTVMLLVQMAKETDQMNLTKAAEAVERLGGHG